MPTLLSDPWLSAMLDAATAPYRALWSAAAQQAFREQMALTFVTHPAARALLARARPALAAQLPPLAPDAAPAPLLPRVSRRRNG